MQIMCSYLLPEQARWVYLDSPHWSRKKRLSFWPQNKPFIDQACSVKMAGYCPLFVCFYRPRLRHGP